MDSNYLPTYLPTYTPTSHTSFPLPSLSQTPHEPPTPNQPIHLPTLPSSSKTPFHRTLSLFLPTIISIYPLYSSSKTPNPNNHPNRNAQKNPSRESNPSLPRHRFHTPSPPKKKKRFIHPFQASNTVSSPPKRRRIHPAEYEYSYLSTSQKPPIFASQLRCRKPPKKKRHESFPQSS